MDENSDTFDQTNSNQTQNSNPFKQNGANSGNQNPRSNHVQDPKQRMIGLKKSTSKVNPTDNQDEQENPEVETEQNQTNEFKNQETSDLEFEKLKTENNTLKQEVEDWKNKSIRLAADIQNINKQNLFEVGAAKKSTKKRVVTSILGFLNTLNLSFEHLPQTEDEKVISFINTLKTAFEQVSKSLELENIEIVKPNIGEVFNAETMNILNPETSNDKEAVVKVVVSLGLKIDGQIVQPASIMI
jgi:molecular chaperone GrpE